MTNLTDSQIASLRALLRSEDVNDGGAGITWLKWKGASLGGINALMNRGLAEQYRIDGKVTAILYRITDAGRAALAD